MSIKTDFWMGDGQLLWNRYYSRKGYRFLYTTAPYYWAVTNIKKREIVYFSEGDITIIRSRSKSDYIKELKKCMNFLKEYYPSAYIEMKEDFYDDFMAGKLK